MAGSVNKVILIGHMGKEPEMRYTTNGRAVTNLTVATNRTWKDGNGEKKEATEWHNVEAWGNVAEFIRQYGAKGRKVYIEGRIQTDKYEKDGETKYFTKIVTEQFQFMDSKRSEGEGMPAEETGEIVFS